MKYMGGYMTDSPQEESIMEQGEAVATRLFLQKPVI